MDWWGEGNLLKTAQRNPCLSNAIRVYVCGFHMVRRTTRDTVTKSILLPAKRFPSNGVRARFVHRLSTVRRRRLAKPHSYAHCGHSARKTCQWWWCLPACACVRACVRARWCVVECVHVRIRVRRAGARCTYAIHARARARFAREPQCAGVQHVHNCIARARTSKHRHTSWRCSAMWLVACSCVDVR